MKKLGLVWIKEKQHPEVTSQYPLLWERLFEPGEGAHSHSGTLLKLLSGSDSISPLHHSLPVSCMRATSQASQCSASPPGSNWSTCWVCKALMLDPCPEEVYVAVNPVEELSELFTLLTTDLSLKMQNATLLSTSVSGSYLYFNYMIHLNQPWVLCLQTEGRLCLHVSCPVSFRISLSVSPKLSVLKNFPSFNQITIIFSIPQPDNFIYVLLSHLPWCPQHMHL